MTVQRLIVFTLAGAFYFVLLIYVASELYYNHTYWRLILKKKRRHRWESLLWFERIVLVTLGLSVILVSYFGF
ncbi:MAG: hypothetical protein D6679_04655 [Candidatus Hydrogenedentota bacterium]|nr:MAG: hypothetical protein D6679_04655 [Candidatus Hydrogenedentota bacterium]